MNVSGLSPVAQAAVDAMSKGEDLSGVAEKAGMDPSSLATEDGYSNQGQEPEADLTDPIDTIRDPDQEAEATKVKGSNSSGDVRKQDPGKQGSKDIEEIFVTDHQGVRRKVAIDFSDKEKTKKAYELAAGARKWQVERDQLAKELKPTKEKAQHFDTLNQAYEKGGLKALIETVEGKDGFEKLIQAEIARRQAFEDATPAERRAMELEEAKKAAEARAQEIEAKLKETEEKTLARMEQAEIRSTQGFVDRVFDKYRFEGTLGDPEKEATLDDLVWTKAQKAFEAFPDDQEIPTAVVEQEFRKAAMAVRKLIDNVAEKQTEKIIQKKKQATAENVQKKTMSGYKTNSQADDAKKLLRKGDMMSILTNWDEYKKYF
jgi:hypothetical protein